jgi:uncharacterized DUF497 family protein
MGQGEQGREQLSQTRRPHARSDSGFCDTDDESDPDEQRFVTVGMGAMGGLLVVVYTWRGENIRMISARPAEPYERDAYKAET